MRYVFDDATGNLISREDYKRGLVETFGYDDLNRLTSITFNNNTINVGFSENGNISSKGDLGTYEYNATQPHAVSKITPTVGYAPEEQTATYTSFDKLCTLEQGTKSLTLTYGYDFNRRKTVFTDGSTTKTKIFVPGGYEKITEGGSKEFCYISTPAGLTAVYDKTNDEMFYVHPDHLGSIHFITDESGSVEQELSFDAWGRHRNATNWGYSSLPTSKFERGYTFHEHLSEFDLINMNGRVYDPMIARFLSPDPVLQSPGNLQNYNRYSYCFNNPLIYTDPSGEKLRWPKFRRHHWIPIIGQFNYIMEFINDNTVKLRQKMVDAGIPDFNIGGSVNSDGEVTVYAGIGTGDGNMPAISYNSNNGVGFGNANNSGNNQFYYPSVNYNAPEQNAVAGIYEGISKYYRAESNFQYFRDEYWARRTSFEVGRLIYTGWAQEGWNFDGTKDDTWYNRSEALINIYPETYIIAPIRGISQGAMNHNNWVRIGWGKHQGNDVYRIAWGAHPRYSRNIKPTTLRNFNEWLRKQGGGHLDLWKK